MTVRTADDTGADKNRCGLKGSPTQVIETFVPVHDINSEMIEGDPEEAARKLADKLLSMQFPVEAAEPAGCIAGPDVETITGGQQMASIRS